jgi:hypothetical protein
VPKIATIITANQLQDQKIAVISGTFVITRWAVDVGMCAGADW